MDHPVEQSYARSVILEIWDGRNIYTKTHSKVLAYLYTPLLLVSGQKETRKKYWTVSNNGRVWRVDADGAECARHHCAIARIVHGHRDTAPRAPQVRHIYLRSSGTSQETQDTTPVPRILKCPSDE